MRLEEEIKQEQFESSYHKAYLNILVTASRLSGEGTALFKEFGLSSEQFNVLRILRGQHPKPSTLQLIADRMINKQSNATRLVEKLRKSGLVTREVCATNRRKVDILITEAGLSLLEEIDPIVRDMHNRRKALFNDAELEALNELLDKIRG